VRALLVLSLVGCAPAPAERPRQTEATAIVWAGRFGGVGQAPPIEWRPDECGDGKRRGFTWEGKCYVGLYLRDDRILLGWEGSFADSAFAHEMMHALQWQRGVEDPSHARAGDWALVAAADQALRDAGL
jgi:hypothetical protein